jgi:hypothetical protein
MLFFHYFTYTIGRRSAPVNGCRRRRFRRYIYGKVSGIDLQKKSKKKEEKGMECRSTHVLDDLVFLAPHTEVAHHIPGRIRLRILPSGLTIVRRTNLQDILGNIPGIKRMRINSIVGSVVIEYDSTRLPYTFWESLNELRKKPELAADVIERLKSLWEEC